MAETPTPTLRFPDEAGELPRREIVLPKPLPSTGDDFDWHLRDFEGLRRFMLEELAARFPQRRRWTSSDIEVVLVEALAAVLDQISDKADRVAAEHVLETARRPESIRRLLGFIGYDAVREANELPPGPASRQAVRLAIQRLERSWASAPEDMDIARRAGPRSVHRQQRMVSVDDYGRLLERHPLVYRAKAWPQWTGSWTRIRVAVVAYQEAELDRRLAAEAEDPAPGELPPLVLSPRMRDTIERFHARLGLRLPGFETKPSIRTLLELYVEGQRMIGHEVELREPDYVPLELGFEVRIGDRYFRSEVDLAVRRSLSTVPGGFFEHGRLDFGQHVHASDLIELLMSLDGVDNVLVSPFKRAGARYRDQSVTGELRMTELELAVCDNDSKRPGFGRYTLALVGGRTG